LASEVTVVGGGTLSLLATPNAPDADVVVRIVDEYPAGDARFPAGYGYLVTSGWLRASHRDGHDGQGIRPLTPGHEVRLDVEIWPSGYRFERGHRIRIDIYSSDVPRFVPLAEPFELSIDLGASSVSLPVTGT
jgi:predicted acyl esterase